MSCRSSQFSEPAVIPVDLYASLSLRRSRHRRWLLLASSLTLTVIVGRVVQGELQAEVRPQLVPLDLFAFGLLVSVLGAASAWVFVHARAGTPRLAGEMTPDLCRAEAETIVGPSRIEATSSKTDPGSDSS
jgi:hypothetical protein